MKYNRNKTYSLEALGVMTLTDNGIKRNKYVTWVENDTDFFLIDIQL